ncbi:hypothetical protein [Wielerella bovis]|uniref:hypothetical protein n=1 Tax=Wielerella bovis TaxID=2917790 RepID=UPI002019348C|nr:hypothetical protein [Wielerella bovis]MCG7657802.1 hypothetical protein [Wielerella bovis]MCG7660024.1 hypothetical protein [Wielerella bovis]
MYKGFNLDLSNLTNEFVVNLKNRTHSSSYEDYRSIGDNLFEKHENIIQTDLKQFKNMSGQLSGNQIIKKWFPEIKADIFLSHSHKDKDLVICFSGWLYKEFGLTSFIDSTVWGYADDLLRMIDDEYCYSAKTQTYQYNKRNYSTSHVHMMLSTSLMNMIDNCECIIFINTPNSFTPANDINNINNSRNTISPWIFAEMLMSAMIRIQMPSRFKEGIVMDSIQASNESRDFSKSLQINYGVGIEHLTELSITQLEEWRKKSNLLNKEKNLDILYKITSNQKEAIYG